MDPVACLYDNTAPLRLVLGRVPQSSLTSQEQGKGEAWVVYLQVGQHRVRVCVYVCVRVMHA
jgi:hypothetical protein